MRCLKSPLIPLYESGIPETEVGRSRHLPLVKGEREGFREQIPLNPSFSKMDTYKQNRSLAGIFL